MTKQELRNSAREIRNNISEKETKDKAILRNLLTLDAFQTADTVLCYVSKPEEIDTEDLMAYCFSHQKRVAVPHCNNDGLMEFYAIHSLNELSVGSFGIREPDTAKAEALTDYQSSVVIVPGLCFSPNGYRIGYGGGYYDKFLKNNAFISVGLCYNDLIIEELPTEAFDQAVNILITENRILFCDNGGKNG